jgi:hypothetical protein
MTEILFPFLSPRVGRTDVSKVSIESGSLFNIEALSS